MTAPILAGGPAAAVVPILVPHIQLDLKLIQPVRNLAQAARCRTAGKLDEV